MLIAKLLYGPQPIDIWATRDVGSKILRTVELPAKASVHINMQQDFTQRASELQSLRDRAYGGFFIRAESPTARILVKEHIFSQSRQVASPYYGSVDILISHHIQSYPPQMVAGQNATAQTMTCYYSGCYWNGWQISSFHPSIVSTQWLPGWVPRPITAHQPGNATLHSSAQGPINQHGDLGWKDDAVIISVYDATPVINAIVPNSIPAGQTRTVEIWGLYFGTNPSVQAAAGLTVGSIVYSSPNQINVVLTHNPGFPPGQYNVWVTSNGFSGSGFLQAPGGGSQAQGGPKQVGVFCAVPTDETTTSIGWADDLGEPAVHRFVQRLQPTTVSFVNRTVTEDDSTPATDSCWFPGSAVAKTEGVTSGPQSPFPASWPVSALNDWGPDLVGWAIDSVIYYRQQRPLQNPGLGFPCEFTMFQRLTISPCGSGSSAQIYKINNQLKGIISQTGVTSQRSNVTEGRPLTTN